MKYKLQKGRQIGDWLLLDPIPGKKDKWLCKCSCGTQREVLSHNLARGGSKGCGCWRLKFSGIKVGKKFGRWTAVKNITPPKSKRGKWLCKCDCGNFGTVFSYNLKCGHSKSCGCYNTELRLARVRENSPLWKGGKHKDHHGYVYFRVKEKGGSQKRAHTSEHRIVMEKFLGRKLYKNETIHHKNGMRDDNRLKNLELWASNHPVGSRVKDLVKWAKEILKRYEP